MLAHLHQEEHIRSHVPCRHILFCVLEVICIARQSRVACCSEQFYLTMCVTRMLQPLVQTVLVHKFDGARALARVKEGIVWLCFETANPAHDLLIAGLRS